MDTIIVRPATTSDRSQLRLAVVTLQEHERRLHSTRRPGEEIADAYLDWMQNQASESGAVLVAEIDGRFAGFAAGWIEESSNIAETEDSNRVGLISDICVLPEYRGRRIATRLLDALEHRLRDAGVQRVRICSLAANSAARASYERAGFVPYEVIYEKVLGPDAT